MYAKKLLFPVISGLLTVFALFHLLPWLAMGSLVPLLYMLKNATFKETLKITAIFGASFGLIFFSWIPGSARMFSGQWMHGALILLAFTLLLTLYFLLLFGIYYLLKRPGKAPLHHGLMLAATVVLLDYGKDTLLATMPWFDFHFGNAFAGSIYTIQLAELGGVYLLSFLTVLINTMVLGVIEKEFKFKFLAIGLVLFLMANLVLYTYRSTTPKTQGIKLNLLTENIAPNIKWETAGNDLVNELLLLSQQAANKPAAINIWSETVVPWTYLPKDDFLMEILAHTQQTNALTLLGMNTKAGSHRVFDSAYLLTSKGKVLDRYDKHYPLAIIESSLKGFTEQWRGTAVEAGKQAKVMTAPMAKFGVYICNEASLPGVAGKLVASGASFLVNISNDGWFANSFIPKQHFYYNRLRAVENRRDVAANSNMGYKGVAAASGLMDIHAPTKAIELTQVTVYPQHGQTLYGIFPWIMLLLSSILIIHYKYQKE